VILVVILSVDNLYEQSWSKIFLNFNEAKLVILEWENERRGKYESEETWSNVIDKMYEIEISSKSEMEKINALMSEVARILLIPTHIFTKRWMLVEALKTKRMIRYYNYNPEEKE